MSWGLEIREVEVVRPTRCQNANDDEKRRRKQGHLKFSAFFSFVTVVMPRFARFFVRLSLSSLLHQIKQSLWNLVLFYSFNELRVLFLFSSLQTCLLARRKKTLKVRQWLEPTIERTGWQNNEALYLFLFMKQKLKCSLFLASSSKLLKLIRDSISPSISFIRSFLIPSLTLAFCLDKFM